MAYSKQTWINGESGATPVDADRLNHMEDGIFDATGHPEVLIAADDSSDAAKAIADFVCTGTDDQLTINEAILSTLDISLSPSTLLDDFNQSNGSWTSSNGWGGVMTTVGSKWCSTPFSSMTAYNDGHRGKFTGLLSYDFVAGDHCIYYATFRAWFAQVNANAFFVSADCDNNVVKISYHNNTAGTVVLDSVSHTFTDGVTYNLEIYFVGDTLIYAKINGSTVLSNVDLSYTGEMPGTYIVAGASCFSSVAFIDNLRLRYDATTGKGAAKMLAGTYSVSNTIHIPCEFVLSGGGVARLIPTDDIVADTSIISLEAENITVEGLVFESLLAQTENVVGIDTGKNGGSRHSYIKNNRFYLFRGTGIHLYAWGYSVTDNYFWRGVGGHAIYSEAYESLISGNTFDQHNGGNDSNLWGLYCEYGGGIHVVGNRFDSCDNGAWFFDDETGDNGSNSFTGNMIQYNYNDALQLDYQFGTTISGNMITENSGKGITMIHCDQINLSGNTITFQSGYALDMQGCHDCSISSNVIADNASDTNKQIRLTNSPDATPVASSQNMFQGNTIRLEQPLGGDSYYGNDPDYGLYIETGTLDTWVTGNDFRDGGGISGFVDNGTGTITTSGNLT